MLLFSCSVVSDCLRPHGVHRTRLPSPSLLLEHAQTHVHRVSDAIQPSHRLLSPSPPVFNLSQHQGLFQWVSFSHQVAKVLELQLQHQSFQWGFRVGCLYDWLVWSLCSPRTSGGDSQEFSPTPQFESIDSLALSLFMVQLTHPHVTTGKTIALTIWMDLWAE